MLDTYKGESLSKKIARYTTWKLVSEKLGGLSSGRFLCLTSREGGDISTLLGMGARPKNIVGVDIIPEAISQCREVYPGVDLICDDIVNVLKQTSARPPGELYDAVFLDMCSEICPKSLTIGSLGISAVRNGGVLAIAFQRGREKINKDLATQQMRNRKERRAFQWLSKRYGDCWPALGIVWGASKFDGRSAIDSDYVGGRSRLEYIYDALTLSATVTWKRITPMAIVDYQSRTPISNGVPMTIFLFSVASRDSISVNRISAEYSRILKNETFVTQVNCTTGMRQFVEYAISLSASGVDAPAVLNVSPGRLAAWKAHLSRGTYDLISTAAE